MNIEKTLYHGLASISADMQSLQLALRDLGAYMKKHKSCAAHIVRKGDKLTISFDGIRSKSANMVIVPNKTLRSVFSGSIIRPSQSPNQPRAARG